MKLLVSVQNLTEALEATDGNVDIVDVKNPKEGALGANFPWVIEQIKERMPSHIEVSATIGDLPFLPGTASLAALGATASGARYVKAGIYGVKDGDSALELVGSVCKAAKAWNGKVMVVAAGYADYSEVGSLNPLELPVIAQGAKADVVMIDVKRKNSRKLFDYFSIEQLNRFVRESHRNGLLAALAGSLGYEDVRKIYDIGADVLGVRRAVCVNGQVSSQEVRRLANAVKAL